MQDQGRVAAELARVERGDPGNIIPDFPVVNKSFNLSYSGTDR
jgi:Ni,Fe-hydrogenase III large subunit